MGARSIGGGVGGGAGGGAALRVARAFTSGSAASVNLLRALLVRSLRPAVSRDSEDMSISGSLIEEISISGSLIAEMSISGSFTEERSGAARLRVADSSNSSAEAGCTASGLGGSEEISGSLRLDRSGASGSFRLERSGASGSLRFARSGSFSPEKPEKSGA